MFWPFDRLWRRHENERHPESLAFDERWGTETAAFDRYNYEPSLPSVVDAILDRVPVAGHTFLDLGSGKGRVVFQAAQRPFRRVIGLEHDYDLHSAAVRNFDVFSRRAEGLAPVQLVHGDAQQHALPDGRLVVYLYNPFPAVVLGRVGRRLARSDVLLVYVNPFEAAMLDGWTEVGCGGEAPWAWRMFRFTDARM
jgi:SAM-dependent methyltransferase